MSNNYPEKQKRNIFSAIYWWTKKHKLNTGFRFDLASNESILVPNLSRSILRSVDTMIFLYKNVREEGVKYDFTV